jgi:integrase/recombinase XerC
MNGDEVTSAEVQAARVLLARIGVTPEQLLNSTASPPHMPTFSEYIDRVSQAVTKGSRRVYTSYWNRIREVWGDRRLNEPTPLEIKQLTEQIKSTVVVRRNGRGGRVAAEHLISALRCLYHYAVADGLMQDRDNPAMRVDKPRRLASSRRALQDAQLAKINEIAVSTGNDPELDALLIRLHTETACRRGGALALRPCDLDAEQCLIRLREKGETERWQPVSPTLMRHLLRQVDERGDGDPFGQLLRYRNGRPITTRRYDHLWKRLGRHLPWVAVQGISTHWLRHTTLTWVERTFGYAVARAYAGHNGRRDNGTTATYVRADVYEVALALAALTAEPHPLVPVVNAGRRPADRMIGAQAWCREAQQQPASGRQAMAVPASGIPAV